MKRSGAERRAAKGLLSLNLRVVSNLRVTSPGPGGGEGDRVTDLFICSRKQSLVALGSLLLCLMGLLALCQPLKKEAAPSGGGESGGWLVPSLTPEQLAKDE